MTDAAHFYKGTVMHCRFEPFRHRFRYGVFSLCFDLDRLTEAAAASRWFSVNRFNLMGFYDRDHGARDGSPLRPWVDAIQAQHDLPTGGQIRIHCFPRVLGYVFNPLTLFFCHAPDGPLQAILYEVRNTFGDKHVYFAPVADARDRDGPVMQRCAKRFHVSPFLDIAGDYRFRVTEPEEKLSILIKHTLGGRDVLIATHNGSREPFTDGMILKNLLRFPLMTLTVMAAIHWQALKLWRKGATFHKRPDPPASPVTRS
jgi:DUF1365 family protein